MDQGRRRGRKLIDFLLLFFLIVCAITAIRMKDLLSAIMILSAYSLIMAVVWTRLNAVDVAFTEASVGAGITSMLLIAALSRTKRNEKDSADIKKTFGGNRSSLSSKILPVFAVVITGAVLIYGTLDMPDFGDPEAPTNKHVANRYIEKSYKETGIVNFVTAVLAGYRGYDTFGETVVVFTAGICVVLLLRKRRPDETV